jgi:hypothetical protein
VYEPQNPSRLSADPETMASGATWQDHEPSEAKTWHGWDGSSWDTESEAKAKTWQEGSSQQPNTAGNTTWQDAESEATTWQDRVEVPRVGHWWHDQVNLDHYHRRPNDQASIRSDSSSHSSMPELVHSSDSADSADSADSDVEADADDAGAAPSTGLATTAHVVPLLLHMQVAGGLGEDSRAAVNGCELRPPPEVSLSRDSLFPGTAGDQAIK